jgi:diadenylate cyclase
VLTIDEREKVVFEIMDAVEFLKKNKIGALIVIERDMSLQEYINPATKVYADLTSPLLGTIFFPNSPLHDGGVIIQGDRITCAGAVFKTSMDPNLSKNLGTRHRAALGIAEETDALALVVSEETGKISIASDSELKYNLTLDEFRKTLVDELKPKTEVFYNAEADVEKDGDM